MADFELKTIEYGTTILKLVRVKEFIDGTQRLFGNILFSIRHYREQHNEMMHVRIIPLSGITKISGTNRYTIQADAKLSINKIYVNANHNNQSIEFGPLQGLLIDESIANRGIGTFAMNELVKWVKQNFEEYVVVPFEFVGTDSMTTDDKEIRIKFLENFGFNLNFSDVSRKNGSMKARRVSFLREYLNFDKVDEIEIEPYFFNLIKEKFDIDKQYNELKIDYQLRGEELLGGIQKADLIKYSIIFIAMVLAIFIFLMSSK